MTLSFVWSSIRAHVAWIAIIAVGLIAGHAWLAEHDARLLADQTAQVAEQQIKDSQSKIDTLLAQIADNDAKAQKQIADLTKTVATVKSSQQAAVALPKIADLPEPVQVQADQGWLIPQPDVLPLFDQLAAGKVAETQLATCQSDYAAEQSIVSQKDSQLASKDAEIAALQKKPSFFKRLGSTLKTVGVGIAIGALAAHAI